MPSSDLFERSPWFLRLLLCRQFCRQMAILRLLLQLLTISALLAAVGDAAGLELDILSCIIPVPGRQDIRLDHLRQAVDEALNMASTTEKLMTNAELDRNSNAAKRVEHATDTMLATQIGGRTWRKAKSRLCSALSEPKPCTRLHRRHLLQIITKMLPP